jgi:hypothetical protein
MFLRLLLVLRKSAHRPVKTSSDVLCSVRSWLIMPCDACFGRGKQTAIRNIIPFTLRQTLQEHNLFEFPLVTGRVGIGFEGTDRSFFLRYMDKTGFSGSRIQLINGVLLLASFTALRIIYGGYIVRTY